MPIQKQCEIQLHRILKFTLAYWMMTIGWIPYGFSLYFAELGWTIFGIGIFSYVILANALGIYLKRVKCPRCGKRFFLGDEEWALMTWLLFRTRCRHCHLSLLNPKVRAQQNP
jgi:hypothetical protein